MRRRAEQFLTEWRGRPGRKPLVLRGARQVGKTYLVENWGAQNFKSVLKVDLERERDGRLVNAGSAPYLDYAPPTEEQRRAIEPLLHETWLTDGVERKTITHAIQHLVPDHVREVKARREALVDKTLQQVQKRLVAEIRYWDQRANDLRALEEAGRGGRQAELR